MNIVSPAKGDKMNFANSLTVTHAGMVLDTDPVALDRIEAVGLVAIKECLKALCNATGNASVYDATVGTTIPWKGVDTVYNAKVEDLIDSLQVAMEAIKNKVIV
jgi:hypothetical protein